MADEITITTNVSVVNGNLSRTVSNSGTADQTDAYVAQVTRLLTTSAEQITDADINTIGQVHIINYDATDSVDFGDGSASTTFSVRPGTSATFNADGSALWVAASANTVFCDVFIAQA